MLSDEGLPALLANKNLKRLIISHNSGVATHILDTIKNANHLVYLKIKRVMIEPAIAKKVKLKIKDNIAQANAKYALDDMAYDNREYCLKHVLLRPRRLVWFIPIQAGTAKRLIIPSLASLVITRKNYVKIAYLSTAQSQRIICKVNPASSK